MSSSLRVKSLPDPLPELVAREGLTDLFINGFRQVWWAGSTGIHQIVSPFRSEEELADFAQGLAALDDKRLDLSMPFADVSLAGGLRAHLVLASGCSESTIISIRSHAGQQRTLEQLLTDGFLSLQQFKRLKAAISERKSFLICGPTGSGKTTLLRAMLAECVGERLVVLEDTPELGNLGANAVSLRTRQSNVEGKGQIDLSRLVVEALRMKPDRIVIGEVRSVELVPMLQALNTGHKGSASTLHANSIEDVPNRLLAIARMAGLDSWVLGHLAHSAIDLLIQLSPRGRCRVESIGRFSKNRQGWLAVEAEANDSFERNLTIA
jgi:pilus assembly protein CpaF